MAVEFNKADLAFGTDQFVFEEDFDLDYFDTEGTDDNRNSRYIRPKLAKFLRANIRYNHAKDLAEDLVINKGERMNVIISGNFVFGDLIEAWLVKNDYQCEECFISTLSMSKQNVDSLKALLQNEWIVNFHLLLSEYYYSHEQYKMMPYLMNTLDFNDRFQCSICATHCKVILLKLCDGRHIVMHGSANLRSSASIEQMCIEECEETYNFYRELFVDIENKYHIIQHAVRRNELWHGLEKHIEKSGD